MTGMRRHFTSIDPRQRRSLAGAGPARARVTVARHVWSAGFLVSAYQAVIVADFSDAIADTRQFRPELLKRATRCSAAGTTKSP